VNLKSVDYESHFYWTYLKTSIIPLLMQTHTSAESSPREKVLEHIFIGDLLRTMWCKGIYDVEVLRPEVDRGGYDVVFECKGIIRHVQLKASYTTAKTASVSVNMNLSRKPNGCIIWMRCDPTTMDLGPFLWFGGTPGEPLPSLGDKIARHSRGNSQGHKAERPNIRSLQKGRFTKLDSMEEVIEALFS
jgi:hypothetical protein